MGFILIVITWLLTPVLEIVSLFTVLWVKRKEYSFIKTVSDFFKYASIDRDRFGNHNYKTALNFWLSKGGYEFGNASETISSVFGKKGVEKTLSIFGWFWYYLLYALDISNWKKGGHCFASINNKI